jgi:uncharacterized protein (DUF1778 family)
MPDLLIAESGGGAGVRLRKTASGAKAQIASKMRVAEPHKYACTDVVRALDYRANLEIRHMATRAMNRDDRIELRTTKQEKRLLATAAAHERLDVTSFIMRNVMPAAKEVVDRAERIVLSERDSARVLKLLDNPPKPTPALLAAARRRARRD